MRNCRWQIPLRVVWPTPLTVNGVEPRPDHPASGRGHSLKSLRGNFVFQATCSGARNLSRLGREGGILGSGRCPPKGGRYKS